MDYDLIVVKTLERVYKNYYYIIRGDEIRFFYREDWKNRTLKENEYIQGIFSMEKVEDE